MIQTLITESPVEALDMAVLHRFARLNVQQRDLPFLAPNDKVSAREFKPVIAANHFRLPPLAHDPVQHSRHPATRQARVDFDGGTRARIERWAARERHARTVLMHLAGQIEADLVDWQSFSLAYYETLRRVLRLLRVPEAEVDELTHSFLVKAAESGQAADIEEASDVLLKAIECEGWMSRDPYRR